MQTVPSQECRRDGRIDDEPLGLEARAPGCAVLAIVIGAAIGIVVGYFACATEFGEATMEQLQKRIKNSGLDENSLTELELLEGELHNSVIGILRNPLIDSSYRRMHNYLRLVRLDRRWTEPLALRSIREHVAIIDACQARDPDAAETALMAHFTAALQRHMGLF